MRDIEKTAAARRFRKKLTRAEVLLWSRVKDEQLGWRVRRQHPVGPYIADFACIEAQVIIEVDGATHGSLEEIGHDERRTRYLEGNDWRVIRVHNDEVIRNGAGVVEMILIACNENHARLTNR